LLVSTNIENANIPETARLSTYGQMLERLGAIPGVVSVSQCWFTPLFGYMWSNSIQVDGGQNPSSGDPEVYFNWITPGYFSTMRTPLLAGRTFDANDTLSSPPVAVVNETMAQHFFPNANPIGKYFRIGDPPKADAQPLQIVGIVKDSRYESSLREPAPPFAYFPAAQVKSLPNSSNFELRTAVDPNFVIPSVRDAMAGVNKAASLQFVTLERQVDDTLVQERLLATLSAFFGGLALLLTAIGLYGVMAYVVSQRTHEIGIRMALGANSSSVLRLVMGDVAALLAAGVAAGALASYWATRLTQQFLFGVQARDAWTVGLAVGALFAVALFASYLPARRAMRVDPMIALRYE
jgi:predicted permease